MLPLEECCLKSMLPYLLVEAVLHCHIVLKLGDSSGRLMQLHPVSLAFAFKRVVVTTGNQHGRSLLQDASAPAPAMQPVIGANSGPSMTPSPTSRSTPAATAASVFSTATTVPAITSVASLSFYATVAAFNTTEQTRVSCTLSF